MDVKFVMDGTQQQQEDSLQYYIGLTCYDKSVCVVIGLVMGPIELCIIDLIWMFYIKGNNVCVCVRHQKYQRLLILTTWLPNSHLFLLHVEWTDKTLSLLQNERG